jgi:hypothetical protein
VAEPASAEPWRTFVPGAVIASPYWTGMVPRRKELQ